ncbi:MAG: HupE/UreJ family protein [Myxococcota bacterium]
MARLRSLVQLLLLVMFSLCARSAFAHGLAMDQLILRPDFRERQLRGQITFNPHHTRQDNQAGDEAIQRSVIAALEDAVAIEIDGKRCPIAFELRELWAPAGATVGDIVNLSCPLAPGAREMRVFAAKSLATLVVSVDMPNQRGAALSHSVLIRGGELTPSYRFGEAARDWREGGADQFLSESAAVPSSGGPQTPQKNQLTPPNEVSRAKTLGSAADANAAPTNGESGFERASGFDLAVRYLRLGFVHILPLGWDHVLFVAGLVLGAGRRWRRLLLELSCFTLAHTLTLGLGALGWVVLSPRLVEPLIAFSIAFVAFENLRGHVGARHRLLLVVGFGLLHGQGFASALMEIGLNRQTFLLSLVSFNLGVELGQLVVVLVLSILLFAIRDEHQLQRYAVRPGSLVIAAVGLVWAIQRLFA